jgi:hypothetical protein
MERIIINLRSLAATVTFFIFFLPFHSLGNSTSLIPQVNSITCSARLAGTGNLAFSLDEDVLEAFQRTQLAYKHDKLMWDWVLQETTPRHVYSRRIKIGERIEGSIAGFLGENKVLLTDLVREVPLMTRVLAPLFQMRWDGDNIFDLPKEYKSLDPEKRPFEVKDDPEVFGNFSKVLVNQKIYKGRGFVPVLINGNSIVQLRFKIIIHKILVTGKTTLVSSLSFSTRGNSEFSPLTAIYHQAFPGRPVTKKEVKKNGIIIFNVDSGEQELNERTLVDVIERLNYLGTLTSSGSILPGPSTEAEGPIGEIKKLRDDR